MHTEVWGSQCSPIWMTRQNCSNYRVSLSFLSLSLSCRSVTLLFLASHAPTLIFLPACSSPQWYPLSYLFLFSHFTCVCVCVYRGMGQEPRTRSKNENNLFFQSQFPTHNPQGWINGEGGGLAVHYSFL